MIFHFLLLEVPLSCTKRSEKSRQSVKSKTRFKGIGSRDFGGFQMILMDRLVVPDVPLEVFFLSFSYSYSSSKFERVKLLLIHVAKA